MLTLLFMRAIMRHSTVAHLTCVIRATGLILMYLLSAGATGKLLQSFDNNAL